MPSGSLGTTLLVHPIQGAAEAASGTKGAS